MAEVMYGRMTATTPASAATPASPAPSRRRVTAVLVGLAAVAALAIVGRSVGGQVAAFAQWVQGLGAWGPVVFIAGYVVATVCFVPGSLLTLAAGAIFGVPRGVAFVLVGATLGATAAFLVSRYVARRAIERRLAGHPRFAAIDTAIGEQGRRIVFLLRLSPVVPFTLLNYALGLTQVRLVDFVAASIGMLPGTLLYVYYGKLAGDLAALAGGAAPPRGAEYYVVLTVGLAATIAATTVVTRMARNALNGVV
jgi:uncharacterized membrane protein YdjX (TVP38/TMEM64 family)